MAAVFGFDGSFHAGEENIQQLLRVPKQDNPTAPYLPPGVSRYVASCQLIAVGTTSPSGQPWASLLAGPPGFAQGVGAGVLAMQSPIPAGDPIYENLQEEGWGEAESGHAKGEGMVAGLAMNLERRQRVKLYGRSKRGMHKVDKTEIGMVLAIEQTLGNCPKYMNARHLDLVPVQVPTNTTDNFQVPVSLPQEALDLISRSDMFFVASRNGFIDMDVNHRGGPPGFVRVIPNEPSSQATAEQPTTLVWPEYSGNRLYQTLGNFQVTPLAGLTFPDFNTGDMLFLTGKVEILIGDDAERVINRSKLAVKFTVTEARYSPASFVLRLAETERVGWSPYNPAVRYLTTEKHGQKAGLAGEQDGMMARLVKKDKLSDSIARFTFQLDGGNRKPDELWRAGQYVMLNFEEDLSAGYRHMDDSDPQGLNDDYIRSFTVSSPPGQFQGRDAGKFEITIRRVGPVTRYLFQQNPGALLEVPVQGFGGEFFIEKCAGGKIGIVAAGVGITPFIAQWEELMKAELDVKLFWAVRERDLPFVKETLEREGMKGMKEALRLFITRRQEGEEVDAPVANVQYRRIQKTDLIEEGDTDTSRKWYVCTAKDMQKEVLEWLQGQQVSWEDFTY
ncbi:hypothetical protein Dda_9005 [Drechslerella dactyloides]|uniref:FAD-binding FR-type domain-containing protein n=1 Tax=Drechslerella dactyloides TaxID=74499 RepID=A0AAD6IRF0_DREDA|nr:hypothetical protein Dda_9005 [Drechslerella dactyloides]